MSDIIYIDGKPHKVVVAVDKDGNAIGGGGGTGGDVNVLNFPTDYATANNQTDQTDVLTDILSAAQVIAANSDSRVISGFVDANNIRYFVRFDPTDASPVKIYRLDTGAEYTPVPPVQLESSFDVDIVSYLAKSNGSGYVANDTLTKYTDTETKSATWRNETQNTSISAPTPGTYATIEVSGQATLAEQQTQSTRLQDISNVLGTTSDAPAASDVVDATLSSLVRRGLVNWTSLLARTPSSLGQTTSSGSTPVVIASDQSTVSVGISRGIPCAGFGTYPTGTNLITGTAAYVSTDSLGDPQAVRFSLQTQGTYTGFNVNLRVADDAAGTNAQDVQVRYPNGSYGSSWFYSGGSFSSVGTNIESVGGLVGKFISVVLTSAGTGGGSIRIRKLSSLPTPVYTQVEIIPVQTFNTTAVSGAYSYGHNVHLSSVLGIASANSVVGPSDSDRRIMTDGVTPMFAHTASPWNVITGLNTFSRTVNLSAFTAFTGAQSLSITNPKMIGLVTLELQVTASGSGGSLDIDFMYVSGDSTSIFAKPFKRITTSGTYTAKIFVPRNTQQLFIRYNYVGSAGSTFNVTAPNWIKGSHYGPEMYKNVFFDYSTLATNTTTSQTIDLEDHFYAKRIMFQGITSTAGTGILSFEQSMDGANFFKITGSETSFTSALNQPVQASLNNGLSPVMLLRFIRVRLETGATAVLGTENKFLISN